MIKNAFHIALMAAAILSQAPAYADIGATLTLFQGYRVNDPTYREQETLSIDGSSSTFVQQTSGSLPDSNPMSMVLAGEALKVRVRISQNISSGQSIPDGKEIDSAQVGYTIDGGKETYLPVKFQTIPGMFGSTSEGEAVVSVPVSASKQVVYWARLTRKSGDTVYLSHGSLNYAMTVAPLLGNQIAFPAPDQGGWRTSANGGVIAGGAIHFTYDSRRMDALGMPEPKAPNAWTHPYRQITAVVSFTDQQGQNLRTLEVQSSFKAPVVVLVPEQAYKVNFKFKAANESGRTVWDQDLGGQGFSFPTNRN